MSSIQGIHTDRVAFIAIPPADWAMLRPERGSFALIFVINFPWLLLDPHRYQDVSEQTWFQG